MYVASFLMIPYLRTVSRIFSMLTLFTVSAIDSVRDPLDWRLNLLPVVQLCSLQLHVRWLRHHFN